jgi:hypothetical protein
MQHNIAFVTNVEHGSSTYPLLVSNCHTSCQGYADSTSTLTLQLLADLTTHISTSKSLSWAVTHHQSPTTVLQTLLRASTQVPHPSAYRHKLVG